LEQDDAHALAMARQIWDGSHESTLPVHVTGTNFQLKVWQALIDLGARTQTTYSEVAESLGRSSSMRAVGNAVGANTVAWLIPCHNVLRKDGSLGGYHWGADRKHAMLAYEGLTRAAQNM
jgi:AraC family transcriptional regulator, regulatory protein of adaptative response / methylated-DNA-[protein]-cysteine methyltransferase